MKWLNNLKEIFIAGSHVKVFLLKSRNAKNNTFPDWLKKNKYIYTQPNSFLNSSMTSIVPIFYFKQHVTA